MQVLGFGLGLPSSIQKYEVRVEADGSELKPEFLSPYVNMLKIKIPDSLINAKFADAGEIRKLPVKITSTHTVKCGFLWLNTCFEPYSLTFDVKLYPRIGGMIIVNQIRPKSVLVNHATLFTNEIATGDHNNKSEGV